MVYDRGVRDEPVYLVEKEYEAVYRQLMFSQTGSRIESARAQDIIKTFCFIMPSATIISGILAVIVFTVYGAFNYGHRRKDMPTGEHEYSLMNLV